MDDEAELAAVIGAAIAAHAGTLHKLKHISKLSCDGRQPFQGWGVSRWGRGTTSPWAFAGRLEQMGQRSS